MNTLENISASDLIKKSAKAICYFRKKRQTFKVTDRMIKGNEAAERKTISELKEMRGSYAIDNILIHYTFDEIQKEDNNITLIEHKNIEEDSIVEDWYVNYSILQLAFYYSLLLKNKSKEYYTAKFLRKQGYNTNYIKLSNDNIITAILYIGNDRYEVKPTAPTKIVNFYIDKANATFEYETAIEWDTKWKFKEYNHFKKNILINKL
jgi:hypothetical protein